MGKKFTWAKKLAKNSCALKITSRGQKNNHVGRKNFLGK
jgi:hypothetical protein